jgi:hypothetical protein
VAVGVGIIAGKGAVVSSSKGVFVNYLEYQEQEKDTMLWYLFAV